MAGKKECPDPRFTPSNLFGKANESIAVINNITVRSLVDTGSMVSTVSETFFFSKLTDCTLEPLSDLVKIECADGEPLPYLGFTELNIKPT